MSNTASLNVIQRGRVIMNEYPWVKNGGLFLAGALVLAILIWQAVTAGGNPSPTGNGISPGAGLVYTAVLVYREGLECILVLSAIVAGLVRTRKIYWKPIATGAGAGTAASAATWFILIGILSLVANTVSEVNIQAATGLLAVVVLMVVMNWFFHSIYWTGWISFQNKKKKEYIESAEEAKGRGTAAAKSMAYSGLFMVGFASVYREGFEVDIFLQNIRMQIGSLNVYFGCALALVLLLITGYFTFIAHQKLPYKKMLVFTGITLGAVFEIIVGEQIHEMQQAHWIPTHAIAIHIPDWVSLWFAVYNNWETMIAQGVAAIIVIGSYYAAQITKKRSKYKRQRAG
ncbi:MAG TPA: FTR1 family protein [Balneolaceae bacterium]|nr:FTR1 family protein [Balneolaceae bacterium]